VNATPYQEIRERLMALEECLAQLAGPGLVMRAAQRLINETLKIVGDLGAEDTQITQEMCPHGVRVITGGMGTRCSCCGTATFKKQCATCSQPPPRALR